LLAVEGGLRAFDRILSACVEKLRSNGPEAHNALTIKPNHSMGARQLRNLAWIGA